MPVTFPDNIYYADTATTSNDVSLSASEATSVQAAFNNRAFRTYRWPSAAARTAQTGMSSGDQGYQNDTGAKYTYLGSAWVQEFQIVAQGVLPAFTAGSAQPTGTTLSSVVLPAIPVATLTSFNISAQQGNTGGTINGGLRFSPSFGSPGLIDMQVQDVRSGTWQGVPFSPYVTIPANTASTITISTLSSGSLLWNLRGTYLRTVA